MRACVLLLLVGCGRPSVVADAGQVAPSFIALAQDFDDFESWQRFDLGHQAAGAVHPAGPRSVFLKAPPPRGATAFPTGSILVKVVYGNPDAGQGDQVFGMAKRGGGFNDAGATGWEWFELDERAQPRVFVWRGAEPPSKLGYGGGAGGACNACHHEAGNDHVLSAELALDRF